MSKSFRYPAAIVLLIAIAAISVTRLVVNRKVALKAAASGPRIYFITDGFFGATSTQVLTGIQALTQDLRAHGLAGEIQVVHNSEWKRTCAAIMNATELTRPLVLIGHGLGGQAAMDVSRCLGSHHRRVDLAITLDSEQKVLHPPVGIVPTNVRLNTNFSQANDWLVRGHPTNHRADGSLRGVTNTVVEMPAAIRLSHESLVQVAGETGLLTSLIVQVGQAGKPHPTRNRAIPALAR